MKFYAGCFVLLAVCVLGTQVFALQLTQSDQYFLTPYKLRIDELSRTKSRASMTSILAKIQETASHFATSSHEYLLLDELGKYLLARLPSEATGLSLPLPIAPPPPLFSDSELSGIQAFVATWQPYVTSSMEFAQSCKDQYEVIDRLAREQNFPTALIISSWWREYSCTMANPTNGWGIFQITSHYYEPGPIDEAELLEQVQHFIDFSRHKRTYHDNLAPFDDLPITLGYLHYDVLSIQKHAIMYNGLRKDTTPTTNMYANQNFGFPEEGRDGIVAMVIKVLAWRLEQQKTSR